jgi:hypothetical protein
VTQAATSEKCYNMCTFDINVCMRKDYAEMFSSHLLSVCLRKFYVFLFVCSKLISTLMTIEEKSLLFYHTYPHVF